MKESAFVQRNQSRWQTYELVVNQQKQASPDDLAAVFIQLTDDLSFARTQFPKSRTTAYLNALSSKIHREIYQNKKEDKGRLMAFWKTEIPVIVLAHQKQLGYALIVFLAALAIGALSARNDDSFVRLILGDGYVNKTIENIKNGNPTSIYSSSDSLPMFFNITFNNIRVSLYVFILGIVFSFGTAYYLFSNGIMVGSFLMFFSREKLLSQALPVIMLHGTVELSSIVVAGGAGFILGNSFLFPGTYSRLESLKMGAVKGVKLVLGLIPFFILAGFIESFITRYAFMHWSLKVLIIGLSTILIIYYFIVYPIQLKKNGRI